MRSTRQGSVCTQSLGPRQSSSRWSVVVLGMCLPRSVAGPWRRSRRRGSECRLMAHKVAAAATSAAGTPRQSGDAVIAEYVVEGRLVVLGSLFQPAEHEHTWH